MRAVLDDAERDAREIVAAARREVQAAEPSLGGVASRDERQPGDGASAVSGAPTPFIGELAQAIASVAARVEALEATISARIDVLWEALAAERSSGGAKASPMVLGPAAPSVGAAAPEPERSGPVHTDRVRAVDLALRGYSREQIAAELRSSLSAGEIEQLLDDVLEHA